MHIHASHCIYTNFGTVSWNSRGEKRQEVKVFNTTLHINKTRLLTSDTSTVDFMAWIGARANMCSSPVLCKSELPRSPVVHLGNSGRSFLSKPHPTTQPHCSVGSRALPVKSQRMSINSLVSSTSARVVYIHLCTCLMDLPLFLRL